METLLLHLIGAVGCTVTMTASSLFAPIRKAGCRFLLCHTILRGCPLYCPMCTGFWTGAAVGGLFSYRNTSGAFDVVVTVIMFGFSTSVLSHCCSWWLRSKGHFTEPEHDGWRYGIDGKYEDLD